MKCGFGGGDHHRKAQKESLAAGVIYPAILKSPTIPHDFNLTRLPLLTAPLLLY